MRSTAGSRPLLAVAAMVVVAGFPAAAVSAKDWEVMQVCGASRCVSYRNNDATRVLSGWGQPFSSKQAPAPAPYYAIRIAYPTAASFGITKMVYVPTRHEIRIWHSRTHYSPKPVTAYWRTVPNSAQTTMNRAFAHIAPHPTPKAWPVAG